MPSYSTVHRSLQPGRTRLDWELVADIVRVLTGDEASTAEWRHAYQVAVSQAGDAATICVFDVLPDDQDVFVGRSPQLDILVSSAEATGETPLVAGIEGMAGVGKTRLALHAAHRLLGSGRFTELQLSVNLRGFDRERAPANPSAVLAAFLRKLGVPGDQLRRLDLAGRTEKFRHLLADKEALVLLDNAASEDQVRPLLPSSPQCLTLVTSRRQLDGVPSLRRLHLDVFTPAEALDLLRARVGAERIDAEPEHATRIAEAVGHLPLGLSLTASRIRATSDWSLADHLERILEHRSTFRIDDGIERALDLSYDSVPPDRQRLLRLLGLHPGRDFDVYAAAALADDSTDAAGQCLAGLCRSHLVEQRVPGRYELHDLVRPFAARHALDEDAPSARRAASTRLFEHYRHSSSRAMDLYAPHEAHRRPRFPRPATPNVPLANSADAAAWLETERANLVSLATQFAIDGDAAFAIDLSNLLHRYLDTTAHHDDAEALHTCASRVAEGADRARILNRLGTMHARLGRYQDALGHYRQALSIFREVNDRANVGRTLNNLGIAHQRLGHYNEALALCEQALTLAQESGDQTSVGRTLNNLGLVAIRLGHDVEAEGEIRRAMEVAHETGNRSGESYARTHLAIVLGRLGRDTEAFEHLERALTLSREVDDRTGESYAMSHLGSALARTGADAIHHHELAVSISHEIGDRETEAEALNEMGSSLCLLGRPQKAIERHHESRAIANQVGDRYQEARSENGLAVAYHAINAVEQARAHWNVALEQFRDLNCSRQADEIEDRLRDLESHASERTNKS